MNQTLALVCLGGAVWLLWRKFNPEPGASPSDGKQLATADANGGQIAIDPLTGGIRVGNSTNVVNNYFSTTSGGGEDPNAFNAADYPPATNAFGRLMRIKNSP